MRRKPYTKIGISRIPCTRCGKPSVTQWQICSDGNQYRGLCLKCDIGLNKAVMRFVFGRTREADIERYKGAER